MSQVPSSDEKGRGNHYVGLMMAAPPAGSAGGVVAAATEPLTYMGEDQCPED